MTALVKREIVAIVADGMDWPCAFAERFVTALTDEIAGALLRGEKVLWPGVGVLRVVHRPARVLPLAFGRLENVSQVASRYVVLDQAERTQPDEFGHMLRHPLPETAKRMSRIRALLAKHQKPRHYSGIPKVP